MSQQVIIIGAGFIGLASALYLQKSGYHVILIDRDQPGHGTSSGPACVFANFSCFPVGSPDVLKHLPSMLYHHDTPLAIRWSYMLSLMPWLMHFIKASTPNHWKKITQQLDRLLSHANECNQYLFSQCHAQSLIDQKGVLHIYPDKHRFMHKQEIYQSAHASVVDAKIVTPQEIQALEPHLTPQHNNGHYFESAYHTLDASKLCQQYFKQFLQQGGEYCQSDIQQINPQNNHFICIDTEDKKYQAEYGVICCGAWSKMLCEQLGDKPLLDTERGYHVMFYSEKSLLNRPVMITDKGYYLTPLSDQRIRAAGTVELGGLNKGPWQKRIDFLTDSAQYYLPELSSPQADWMGFRPSMPDSKPVISASSQYPHVFYAFGHGHLGMTLSGITGRCIADLISGHEPLLDLSPFDCRRF